MYTDIVMEHFARPRNVGLVPDADGYARLESDVHHDVIEVSIRVEDGRLAEVRHRTYGCAAAIAASSMTTELARGLTLDEATRLEEGEVVRALGGLPEGKVRCSVLAPAALRAAIAVHRRQGARADTPPGL
jgi:nitrogen fixation NifU-like protein